MKGAIVSLPAHDQRDRCGDRRATHGRREHPGTTTLGGVDTLALTITVPPDDDPARCGASLYEPVWADQPGDVVRSWIVEVADERFIFTAETHPTPPRPTSTRSRAWSSRSRSASSLSDPPACLGAARPYTGRG